MTTTATEYDLDLLNPDTIIAVGDEEFCTEPSPAVVPRYGVRSRTSDAPVRFKVRLADSEGKRSSASYLIQKMYSWRGYSASGPQAAPNRVTLIASDADRALATISIGFDSDEGLAVESLYPEEVERLRARGRRVCEFTRLAVDRNDQSLPVLAMMYHIAYIYAHRLHGCTDLLIEVNPRHVRFYRRMLGFTPAGEQRLCKRVGAPAILLWLDLAYAQKQIEQHGGHREMAEKTRSLYPLFFSPSEEEGIVGRLRAIG